MTTSDNIACDPASSYCTHCSGHSHLCQQSTTNKPHRQIDGNIVKFWPLKRDAIAAAKSIGWMAKDVGQVWTRFQIGYAIHDNDGTWMTKERFYFIANIR